MYLKKFEYFILDSSVAGTLLLMALAIRIEAINAGFDQFSSNIIFNDYPHVVRLYVLDLKSVL